MKINTKELKYTPITSYEIDKCGHKINLKFKTMKDWAKERSKMYLVKTGLV